MGWGGPGTSFCGRRWAIRRPWPWARLRSTPTRPAFAGPGRGPGHWPQRLWAGAVAAAAQLSGRGGVGEETRMMTRAAPLARSREHAEAVLGRLNRLDRPPCAAVHAFDAGRRAAVVSVRGVAPCRRAWQRAIDTAAQGIRQRLAPSTTQRGGEPVVTTPVLLEELHQRKQSAEEGGGQPRGARHHRDRGAAVPEHPHRRPHPGQPCACGLRGCRCRCCAWPSPSPTSSPPSTTRAPPDRPHGRLRDGFRHLAPPRWRERGAGEGDQAHRAGGGGLPRHRPARVPDRAHRVREVPRALLQERERG